MGYFVQHQNLILDKKTFPDPKQMIRGDVYELRYKIKTSTKDKKDNLLLEQEKRKYEEKVKKYQGMYLNRLMESLDKDEKVFNLDDVEKDTEILNSKISDITKEIDNLTK